MRIVCSVLTFLLAVPAADVLAADQQGPAPQIANGLERVPNARVNLAYVKPGTDWSKYRTIELRTLQVPQKVRNAAPNGASPEFGESYVLRDEDVTALQNAYATAMRSHLTNAGYTFVDKPGADTLIVVAQIINIKLAAPVESSRPGFTGGGLTVSPGGGTMTIAAAFADGATGQEIAEAADQYAPVSVWGINNSVANLAEARQGFDKWASELVDRLTEQSGSNNPIN